MKLLIADDRKFPYYFIMEDDMDVRKALSIAEKKVLKDFEEYAYTIEDIREGWTWYFERVEVIE
jgi:hypothetical protein